MRVVFCLFLLLALLPLTTLATAGSVQTLVVSAEGLADPQAAIYQKDRGLLIDDLRADARRQAIEKAVGVLVDSSTLVENYALVQDRVLTKSQGLIKQILKESEPFVGDDGFMHLLIKAEVYLADVRAALEELGRHERRELIRQQGNPRIEVQVVVRDTERGGDANAERSFVAENVLKEHFGAFGYRVWAAGESGVQSADFAVEGEARFKALSARLPASGLTVTKHALTSWSVKCLNLQSGEEIYFNNKVPKGRSWNDEEQALEEIGRMIGEEFSRDFFTDHLMQPSKLFFLQLTGLPDYDSATQLKREFIGLRSVLNVDLREFNAEGTSLFEIDFGGSRQNFVEAIQTQLLEPLNRKFGQPVFSLRAARGETVTVAFISPEPASAVHQTLDQQLPAALYAAAPERLQALIKDESTRERLQAVQPQATLALPAAQAQVRDF
ncbi:MAG: hypothetical protein AB7T15_01970 [Desulfuromonas sp.]